MTFLEMCQKTIRDLGLHTSIATVTNQTEMAQKIVDWVADADEYIQSLWFDWNFLFGQYEENTTIGTREYAKPTDFGMWDMDSFYLDYDSEDYVHLSELDYVEWREIYRQGTLTNDEPNNFILTPLNNIYLEAKPDAVYTLTADYWKSPTRMTVNTSTSLIPDRFQRIIIARAKIYYAEHDEFPTVYELATDEYNHLLNLLEAAELPGKYKAFRKGSNRDIDLTIRPV